MIVEFALEPRNQTLADLIAECAAGRLLFSGPDSLCTKVAAMGFKTTNLYEMVWAAESAKQ